MQITHRVELPAEANALLSALTQLALKTIRVLELLDGENDAETAAKLRAHAERLSTMAQGPAAEPGRRPAAEP